MRPSPCTLSIYLTFLLSPLHFPPSRSLPIHPLPSPRSLFALPLAPALSFFLFTTPSRLPLRAAPPSSAPLSTSASPPFSFPRTPPPPVLPLRTMCDDALAEFTLPNYRPFLTVTLTIPVPLLCFSLHLTLRENQVITLCSFQQKKNPGREGKKKGRRGVTPGIKGFGWVEGGKGG